MKTNDPVTSWGCVLNYTHKTDFDLLWFPPLGLTRLFRQPSLIQFSETTSHLIALIAQAAVLREALPWSGGESILGEHN